MFEALPRKRARGSTPDIPCVVMASHASCLEALHTLIRKGFVPFTVAVLVHVDSHPDMMLPAIRLPDDDVTALYDYLDHATGGIAEWLLPAVARGHVNHIVWMRARWCTQLMPQRETDFSIGETQSGRLGVTLDEPYFADEGHSFVAHELCNAVRAKLTVGDAVDLLGAVPARDEAYVLDVCLDYFAVCNPFYVLATRSALGAAHTDALVAGFCGASFKTLEARRTRGARSAEESAAKVAFECLVERAWAQGALSAADANALGGLLKDDDALRERFLLACEAVHAHGCADVARRLMDNVELPHHPRIDETQRDAFAAWVRGLSHAPLAVTMARSDEDDYVVSPALADALQQWCIDLFEATWGRPLVVCSASSSSSSSS